MYMFVSKKAGIDGTPSRPESHDAIALSCF